MADDKDAKDRGTKGGDASETEKKSGRAKEDDPDEGELTPITPKTGEPPGHLRRRSEWFQKRHRG